MIHRPGHESMTLRPSWRKYVRSIVLNFSPLVVLLALFQFWVAGQSGGRDSAWELLPIGAFVVALAADILIRMGTVVRLTPTTLQVEPPVFLHREISRESVGVRR